MMTHQDREELDRWLLDHQATPDDAGALRAEGAGRSNALISSEVEVACWSSSQEDMCLHQQRSPI